MRGRGSSRVEARALLLLSRDAASRNGPLTGVPSPPRKRISQTLRAHAVTQRYVAQEFLSSLLASLSKAAKAALRTVMSMWSMSMSHDMHGRMVGPRSRADLRWRAHAHTHPKRKERHASPSARAPSNIVPCGCKQAHIVRRWRVGCSSVIASIVVALGRVQ